MSTSLKMASLACACMLASASLSAHPQDEKSMSSNRGNDKMQKDMGMGMGMGTMNRAHLEKMVSGWPKASREAITFLTDKYGPPAAVTADMVVWGKAGPWKRSVVYRTEVAHKFPMPHTDVMQQWLDYKVPASKYDELAMYDGSVVLERTSGEMSARCDKEAANFLAVNLAHEVATGMRSVEDARKKYGEQIMAMMAKRPAPYTEKVMFSTSSSTVDADRPLMMGK